MVNATALMNAYLWTLRNYCICTYVYMHVCMCVCISMYVCMCICMRVCMYVCVMYVRTCTMVPVTAFQLANILDFYALTVGMTDFESVHFRTAKRFGDAIANGTGRARERDLVNTHTCTVLWHPRTRTCIDYKAYARFRRIPFAHLCTVHTPHETHMRAHTSHTT